jgi:phospholipid/cholesterol/gamma-HCH transport system permease protein
MTLRLPSNPLEVPASRAGLLARLGQLFIEKLRSGRELQQLFALTLYFTFRGQRERGARLRQMYEIGNRSLIFLCVVMGFIGMILVYQGGLQTERVVPDLSLLGATFLKLLVRDLGATICALMLATRVGAGIAAEIGSMAVTEQVDALRMCATDPIDFLIKPRFQASLLMFGPLVVLASSVAFGSGMWTGYAFFGINPRTFANLSLVTGPDLLIGVSKCIAYGASIPVISGHAGLTAYGGSEGVGDATTRAVVNSSLAVIVLDFLISGSGTLLFE